MEQKEKTGFIYVLTNESFHKANWIKIGYAEDVDKRVRDLSGTSVPLPYKVYCTYEIPRINGTKDPDKLIHNLIQLLNPGLRISPNREFFEIEPWDAYDMLSAIAQMHGRSDKLRRYEENVVDKPDVEEIECSVEQLFPPKSDIASLYSKLNDVITSLDESIKPKALQRYVAFKKGEGKNCNVACLWPKSGWIEVVLNVKLGSIKDDSGLVYDISNRQWPSAQYALRFNEDTDVEIVKNIVKQICTLKKK